MSHLKNLFSLIKNDEKILLSFDSNYLVFNGKIDSRIIGSLIYIFLQYPSNQFTINDQMGLLGEIIEKSGMSLSINKNILITYQKISDFDYNKYDKIFLPENLKGKLEKAFDTNEYFYQSNIVYFPISIFKNLSYNYERALRKSFEQESFFPEIINNIVSRNSANEKKTIDNIIILDDHLREFYIGDTHMLLSSIRQIQLKTDSSITIAFGSDLLYKKVSQIFTLKPFQNINIIRLKWDTLNLDLFDTVICHQNSILQLLQFYETSADIFLEKKIYRFSPNTEFNNLKLDYPWDINYFFKNLGIETKIKSIKHLKKQTHKEICLMDEEIKAADLWLIENGYFKENRLFILFDESSYSEKTLSISKTLSLIKLILSDCKNNQILLFDYKNIGKKDQLRSHLTSWEFDRIITASGLNIRKEMAIMASSTVFSIIGPCTGMMHLANGIYFELLNNKRRIKEQIPLMIVYCGSGLDKKNYHPRYWWQGAMVKCIAGTKKNDLIVLEELHEISLNIEDFHNNYLPVSDIMPEHIMAFINK